MWSAWVWKLHIFNSHKYPQKNKVLLYTITLVLGDGKSFACTISFPSIPLRLFGIFVCVPSTFACRETHTISIIFARCAIQSDFNCLVFLFHTLFDTFFFACRLLLWELSIYIFVLSGEYVHVMPTYISNEKRNP